MPRLHRSVHIVLGATAVSGVAGFSSPAASRPPASLARSTRSAASTAVAAAAAEHEALHEAAAAAAPRHQEFAVATLFGGAVGAALVARTSLSRRSRYRSIRPVPSQTPRCSSHKASCLVRGPSKRQDDYVALIRAASADEDGYLPEPEDIAAELRYPGLGEVGPEFCTALMRFVCEGGYWPWEEAKKLVSDVGGLLMRERTLERVDVPPGGRITVVGDVHGQLFDLCKILEVHGLPSATNPYVFNGDFVDRGSFSVETLLVLLAWKAAFPQYVRLARGNHEAHEMNVPYGFAGEALMKYGVEGYRDFQRVFIYLPLAHVINSSVLIVHGGLPREGASLDDIEVLDRVAAGFQREEGERAEGEMLFSDLLWADPTAGPGIRPSCRGPGVVTFGPDITDKFLADNSLKLLIRSHEVKDEGFEWAHNNKCLTVFSAPMYADSCDNRGAVIRLTAPYSYEPQDGMKSEVLSFEAAPRPAFYVPAMAYSPMSPLASKFLAPEVAKALGR